MEAAGDVKEGVDSVIDGEKNTDGIDDEKAEGYVEEKINSAIDDENNVDEMDVVEAAGYVEERADSVIDGVEGLMARLFIVLKVK